MSTLIRGEEYLSDDVAEITEDGEIVPFQNISGLYREEGEDGVRAKTTGARFWGGGRLNYIDQTVRR